VRACVHASAFKSQMPLQQKGRGRKGMERKGSVSLRCCFSCRCCCYTRFIMKLKKRPTDRRTDKRAGRKWTLDLFLLFYYIRYVRRGEEKRGETRRDHTTTSVNTPDGTHQSHGQQPRNRTVTYRIAPPRTYCQTLLFTILLIYY